MVRRRVHRPARRHRLPVLAPARERGAVLLGHRARSRRHYRPGPRRTSFPAAYGAAAARSASPAAGAGPPPASAPFASRVSRQSRTWRWTASAARACSARPWAACSRATVPVSHQRRHQLHSGCAVTAADKPSGVGDRAGGVLQPSCRIALLPPPVPARDAARGAGGPVVRCGRRCQPPAEAALERRSRADQRITGRHRHPGHHPSQVAGAQLGGGGMGAGCRLPQHPGPVGRHHRRRTRAATSRCCRRPPGLQPGQRQVRGELAAAEVDQLPRPVPVPRRRDRIPGQHLLPARQRAVALPHEQPP